MASPHFVAELGAAVTGMATALAVAAPVHADISPQYPPGHYHVVEIVCAPETPCPTVDWGVWTVFDAEPGAIRMLTSDGFYLDFHRFDTGWTAISDDTVFDCTGDGTHQVATTSRITLYDSGGNLVIVDDWSVENPFCDGLPEDTYTELQFTPEGFGAVTAA